MCFLYDFPTTKRRMFLRRSSWLLMTWWSISWHRSHTRGTPFTVTSQYAVCRPACLNPQKHPIVMLLGLRLRFIIFTFDAIWRCSQQSYQIRALIVYSAQWPAPSAILELPRTRKTKGFGYCWLLLPNFKEYWIEANANIHVLKYNSISKYEDIFTRKPRRVLLSNV